MVGIGVPKNEARSLAPWCRGFFARSTRQVLWAGRVGRGNPRRFSFRYANLHGLPTPIGVGAGGMTFRLTRTSHMSIFPSAVDRETASRINPCISVLSPVDTIDNVSSVLEELGYLVINTEMATANLFHLFSVLSAALRWENEILHQQEKAARHG